MRNLRRMPLLLVLLLLLCGCGLFARPETGESYESVPGSVASEALDWGSSVLEGILTAPAQSPPAEEMPEALFPEDQMPLQYCREQLTREGRDAYDILAAAVAARQEVAPRVRIREEEFSRVIDAIGADHPEYFWFSGEVSYRYWGEPGEEVDLEATFVYTMDLTEIQRVHRQVEAYTQACLNSVEGAADTWEQLLRVYNYLVEHTAYVPEERDQSMVSVMVDHRGVCSGYTRAYQYLTGRLGIPCTVASGRAESRTGTDAHAWNIVRCDGDWYQVDVTWGDPVDSEGNPSAYTLYTYFMLTDEEMYRDHTPEMDWTLPACTATARNYYIMTGRQMSEWDPDRYEAILREAMAWGQSWVAVRFDRREDYEAAMADLFDAGTIWDRLEGAGAYVPEGMGSHQVDYNYDDLFLEIAVHLEIN